MEKEEPKKYYLDYLDKTFLEELNYKIWSTKGARFNASKRLSETSKISNISTSLLSVYLIITGLLSVYNLYSSDLLDQNLIAYLITSLSIILLVFTQVEHSNSYDLRSKNFHDCALELSRIYNELRIFKTLKGKVTDSEKEEFATKLSEKYEDILSQSENHLLRDFDLFKSRKADYHGLSELDVYWIRFNHYRKHFCFITA